MDKALTLFIQALMAVLTPELLKGLADTLLDWVEDMVLGSASTIDDRLLLPACDLLRKTFDIPDNDEPAPAPE